MRKRARCFCVADEEKHGQHGPPSSIGLIGFVSRFEFFNIYLKIYETMMNNIHLSTLSKKLKCFSKIINKTLELLQMICQGFRCVPSHPFPHSLTDKCHVIHWDPVVCHASIGLSWICPSVGRSVCPKRAGSYTSMLLLENFFSKLCAF